MTDGGSGSHHGRISVFEPIGGAICVRRRQPLIYIVGNRSDDQRNVSTHVLGSTRRFRIKIRDARAIDEYWKR